MEEGDPVDSCDAVRVSVLVCKFCSVSVFDCDYVSLFSPHFASFQ